MEPHTRVRTYVHTHTRVHTYVWVELMEPEKHKLHQGPFPVWGEMRRFIGASVCIFWATCS